VRWYPLCKMPKEDKKAIKRSEKIEAKRAGKKAQRDDKKKGKLAKNLKKDVKKPKIHKRVVHASVFHTKKKNYGIGNDIQPKRDLYHFVKWPRYIRIQRQRKILMGRLKIPPAINQFKRTLNRQAAFALFKLLAAHRPEDKAAKKARLLKIAERRAKGQFINKEIKKGPAIVHGAQEVIKAIEKKKAKLVVIAADVDPVELVVSIPALCRKLDIPYVVVNDKARLGALVYRKHTSAVAVTTLHKEHTTKLANLVVIAREHYNNNVEHRRQWGGGKLGNKSLAVIAKQQKIIAAETAKRLKKPIGAA